MPISVSKLPFSTNVTVLRGVGPAYGKTLAEVGILTIKDLLWSLPYRYIDRGNLQAISALSSNYLLDSNNIVTVFGMVKDIKQSVTRIRYMHLIEVTIDDGTGILRLIWFNQPHISKMLQVGYELLAFGRLTMGHYGLELRSPKCEIINDANKESAWSNNRYLPLYRRLGPIISRTRQRLVQEAITIAKDFNSWLPIELARNLPDTMTSLRFVHQPPDDSDPVALHNRTTLAHHRLCSEELFAFSLGLALRHTSSANRPGQRILTTTLLRKRLKELLPFRLTTAQRLAFKDVVKDLTSGYVMHRLLQGDVGSGKTLVAFLAMAMIAETGGQAVLMVPTEVLARQHATTIGNLLGDSCNNIQLLIGSMKVAEKRQALSRINSGEALYIIGTHALFQETALFHNLQLIVVDEQHRFGVKQREAIKQKGLNPHWLVMSATPIPRSLALAIFGDLDQSVLDELPPGRQPVSTKLIHPSNSESAWKLVDKELKLGHQVFVISPAIDTSNDSNSDVPLTPLRDLKVMEMFLRKRFPEQTITVVHGRLKTKEITNGMAAFVQGEAGILLATTVVEVGVDVPNATVMVVDHAERFGLSQLHQLRGRIGRGTVSSYFLMLSSSETERLLVLTKTNDGFRIAQKDLELRGPGEFFGVRQSGLPQFQVADLVRDKQILFACRKVADQAVKQGLSDDQLQWLRHEQVRLQLVEVS